MWGSAGRTAVEPRHGGGQEDTVRVEEVYRPGALTCDAAEPVPEVARKMIDAHVGALAVLDGDRLVGMISERDLVRAVAEHTDLPRAAAGTFSSTHVQTASLEDDTADVARRMLDAGVRHLPVIEDGSPIGMISMRDLLALETWT
jgi:CBS domain-containing protein